MRVFLVVLLGLAGRSAARAAGPGERADPREPKARASCAAGDVDKGIAILDDIYEETGDLNALYNQARCYQLNGKNKQALYRFKDYRSRVPDLPPDEDARLQGYIRDLTAALERPKQPAPPPAETVAVAPAPEPEPVPEPITTRGEAHGALRSSSAVLGVVAAAAFGTGVYFSLRVRSVQHELDSPSPSLMMATEWSRKVRDGKDAQLYQEISYGVAAAALTGSIMLYVMGRPGTRENRRIGLSANVARHGASGLVQFAF